MVNCYIPRSAESCQAPSTETIPRFGQHAENQCLSIYGMDYKKEIGLRIQKCRDEQGWTQGQLSQKTGDLISLKRISAYETGERMPRPAEIVTLAKALEVRPAFLLAVDDNQMPISPQEEALIRNWRTLAERDRMEVFRKLETMALQARDPVPDQHVERHQPVHKVTQ